MKVKKVALREDAQRSRLRALATEAAGELEVLGLDGDTLGVDSGKVGVLELGYVSCVRQKQVVKATHERNEVSLRGLLESEDSRRLEAEVGLEVLGNLTDETLEGELADQELSRLLVATDLTESDSTGAVTVGLLDATSGGSRLASRLGSELLAGGLATGRLAGGLLGTSHCEEWLVTGGDCKRKRERVREIEWMKRRDKVTVTDVESYSRTLATASFQ
jgi:histone H3